MGADDGGWRLPVNNPEVTSFMEFYMAPIFTTGSGPEQEEYKNIRIFITVQLLTALLRAREEEEAWRWSFMLFFSLPCL